MRGAAPAWGSARRDIGQPRFVNLYVHLRARVAGCRSWLGRVALVVAAGLSHGLRPPRRISFDRSSCRRTGSGPPEDLGAAPKGFTERVAFGLRRLRAPAGRMFPAAIALVRRWRVGGASSGARGFRTPFAPGARTSPWIAQNVRFVLLAVTVVPGWPLALAGYDRAVQRPVAGGVLWLERISRRAFDGAPELLLMSREAGPFRGVISGWGVPTPRICRGTSETRRAAVRDRGRGRLRGTAGGAHRGIPTVRIGT